MLHKTLCLALLCLLAAGCGVTGGSSGTPSDGLKLFPARLQPKSSKKSLIEAVENDPFPRAGRMSPGA